MQTFSKLVTVFAVIILTSCSHKPVDHYDREYQIGSYLWFQTSGEYRALCYQAYNLGKIKLERDLENKHNRKRAVVLDIDETVLDNSVSGALEINKRETWHQDSFDKWVARKAAQAVPGAKEFLQFAVSRQVEVIYVSNRSIAQKMDTFQNLERLGIPVKMENLYFSEGGWSKEKRRQEVQKKYQVVLYFGDNLGDFHSDWDDKKSAARSALVDAHREDFGEKFIILPNPLYGDWEKSLPSSKNRSDLLKTIP